MNLEVGDIVLCTVERIQGTSVFVIIEGIGEGNIVFSEIAPGRIRNIREYVVPKKRIVCKVLRMSQSGNIELSLRRVTQKETKEILDEYKQEKSYESIFRKIMGEQSKEAIIKIKEKNRFYDFVEASKENPKELEKEIGKSYAEKILEILKTNKKKISIAKKEIKLTTHEPNGLELIKEILKDPELNIRYIAAGKYSIEAEALDIKTADNKIKAFIQEIEPKAKQSKMDLVILEK
jgi:translation initiation factor 2 subunit 1